MKFLHFVIALVVLAGAAGCAPQKTNQNTEAPLSYRMYVGTYTRDEGWVHGKAEGIYHITSNQTPGRTTIAEVINPSFLATSPDGKHLYAVSELGGKGEPHGYVYAFEIINHDSLRYIDQYSTVAQATAHVSVHPSGKLVFAANYQGGVAMVYRRHTDGSLQAVQQLNTEGSGPHPNQESSHLHMVKVSPDGKFLYIPDLGSDKIWSFAIDLTQYKVTPTTQQYATVAPGSGPRHMDFHPSGRFAYVLNELNSTLSVFEYSNKDGSLNEIQVLSTLPKDFEEWNSTADIHVHPNGKYLYTSNRGHNSIATFRVDESTGRLTLINHTPSQGEFPRNFALHPDGKHLFVANQNTDNIAIFNLNPDTGILSFTEQSLEVNTPVCILFY